MIQKDINYQRKPCQWLTSPRHVICLFIDRGSNWQAGIYGSNNWYAVDRLGLNTWQQCILVILALVMLYSSTLGVVISICQDILARAHSSGGILAVTHTWASPATTSMTWCDYKYPFDFLLHLSFFSFGSMKHIFLKL